MIYIFILMAIYLLFGKFIVKLCKFIYWKIWDIIHFNPSQLHIYGIWLFCGLYGQGKTMALSEYLTRMREKYKDNIIIATNYGFKGEDFKLTDWKQMLIEYDKPVIFGYDEIQNEFNSREYKSFPPDLIRLLTQNRKGHGKQIVGTAQRFMHVDKVIRDLSSHVVECKTFLGRWTSTKRYDIDDYNQMLACTDTRQKRRIPKIKYSFIQSNKLRDCYNSFQMLESAKLKEYTTLEEKRNQIS